ncbi:hypothetical protein E2C01_072322 [Portunus trituberculatus]|uniref:Uncharacterized protein n=1 Tax=Portunus trituberculatus TaxID=210409 RepID=A0A5B7I6E5_PORTR|nr:hypothetical protein [Portunus trituberculatus]
MATCMLVLCGVFSWVCYTNIRHMKDTPVSEDTRCGKVTECGRGTFGEGVGTARRGKARLSWLEEEEELWWVWQGDWVWRRDIWRCWEGKEEEEEEEEEEELW